MKRRNFTVSGQTNKKGELLIYNKGEFKEFLSHWPESSFTMKLELHEKNTSSALIAYYKNSILPDFQHAFKEVQGLRLSLAHVDVKLREMSSVMHGEVNVPNGGGTVIDFIVSIDEAGTHRAVEFIEDLKVIGATEFHISIKDPKKI